MDSMLRGIVVIGVAAIASGVVAVQLAVGMLGGSVGPQALEAPLSGSFHEYAIDKLEVFEQTVFYVDEKYVDPSRLDWDRMFVAALAAIEREVPSCVITREPGGSVVSIEVGELRTVEEIDPVRDGTELVDAARRVIEIVRPHVDESELSAGEGRVNGWQMLEYAMVNGMLHDVLDPHSVLLPPRDAADMDVENQGEFGGLGVTVQELSGRLTVAYTRADTPAEKAGLRPEDHIIRIEGESTINMPVDDAVLRLRGPIGAPVQIDVLRPGVAEPFEITMIRARIKLNEVRAVLLDGNIGYVEIPGFHADAEAQLHDELTRLKREAGGSLKGLVLDLRGNPGGFYHEGVAVADSFLSEGTLVSTVDRHGRKVDVKQARESGTEPRYPMAVLLDAGSASASEIVAGALRNHDRAVIIGTRSFGKGSVQNLQEYFDGSKLKLTVSRYLTPGDRSIQSVGIGADIALRQVRVDEEGNAAGGVLAMFSSERARRESSLESALDADAWIEETPAWELPYIRQATEWSPRSERDPNDDFEVLLARDVLLASPSWRRADVLSGAARVVSRHRRQSVALLHAELAKHGLDWRVGAAADSSKPLPISIEVSPAQMVAGQRTAFTATATNTGDTPLFQVAAVAGTHDVLDGREFLFGHLPPGGSHAWTVHTTPPVGYPSERGPVSFVVSDVGEGQLGEVRTEIVIQQPPLPAMAWDWSLTDLGDGDGIAEIGEHIGIELTVRNVGEGPTRGAYALVRNHAGRALDIVEGNVIPGSALRADASPCKPAPDDLDCQVQLAPGHTWAGHLEVALVGDDPGGGPFGLELAFGDTEAFDWGAAARAGLMEVLEHREPIEITVGQALASGGARMPPKIEITHQSDAVSQATRATLSGVATDDVGLAHVLIYLGEDKIFHQGAGTASALQAIPFTADVALQEGLNTLVVVAVDTDGLVASRSVVTWSGGPELAKVEALPGR
jgi:carboxyl-terminal processing protease